MAALSSEAQPGAANAVISSKIVNMPRVIDLTTIRRNFLSPISAFTHGEILVKGRHGSFFTGRCPRGQAQTARASAPAFASQALQPSYRRSLSGLDQAVHSFPWQTPPSRTRRNTCLRLLEQSRQSGAGRGFDAKPGAECAPLLVQ